MRKGLGMSKKCPLCDGEGKRIVVVRNSMTNRMKTITEWCLCVKSKYISETYGMLESLKDTYLPLDKIDKKLIFRYDDLSKSPNLLIVNTDRDTFNLHIKSVLIKYRFISNPPFIYYCRSIDLLKKFYVQQEDGLFPSLTDLNRYDLVIFTLDTIEKNAQLSNCVAQVVYNRINIAKPTWIYLPEDTILGNTREYSEELVTYMNPKTAGSQRKYISITLSGTKIKVKATKTESQNIAEGFSL